MSKKPISVLKNKVLENINPNAFTSIEDKGLKSIEDGYFIFTLMPSLRCSLNCPHCYLSLEQRRNSPILSLDDLQITCQKINDFYNQRNIKEKTIINYWYGGEPTEMGEEYFKQAIELINSYFNKENGYSSKHVILTSLLNVDNKWFNFFKKYGEGYFQSSYDGGMRGNVYTKKWELKVRQAVQSGLSLATISVVNKAIIMDGPEATLDYLASIGIVETGWLPFMWNEQNDGESYENFAPKMDEYSDFMIRLSKHYIKRKNEGVFVPEIGTMRFILSQKEKEGFANIAGQTLFLLPNGDFVLPDYKNGYQEYMRKFGNILETDFSTVLKSKERRDYLRKQVLRNNNEECIHCEHADKCVMEFWKENRKGDDCFGAKRYVDWLLQEAKNYNFDFKNTLLF